MYMYMVCEADQAESGQLPFLFMTLTDSFPFPQEMGLVTITSIPSPQGMGLAVFPPLKKWAWYLPYMTLTDSFSFPQRLGLVAGTLRVFLFPQEMDLVILPYLICNFIGGTRVGVHGNRGGTHGTVNFTSLRTCVFRGLSRKLCSANMTLPQCARSFWTPAYSRLCDFRKAPPAEVLAAKLGTEYARSKRSEINSTCVTSADSFPWRLRIALVAEA